MTFEECEAQFTPLLHRYANKRLSYMDEDDTLQGLRLALWRAWRTFSPGRVKFITYASTCLHHELYKLRRSALQSRNRPAMSLDGLAVSLEGSVAELRVLSVQDDMDVGLLLYGAPRDAQHVAAAILTHGAGWKQRVPLGVLARGLPALQRHLSP